MDLLEFSEKSLYFDEPIVEKAKVLIERAAEEYGDSDVEPLLLKAYRITPDHLMVLVSLYRYYYYQHRLRDALKIAHEALTVSGKRLKFPQWYQLSKAHVGTGAIISMGMVRFYLLALKAAGYLNLRLQQWDAAMDMLSKVADLDEADRLGVNPLLDIAASVIESQKPKHVAL